MNETCPKCGAEDWDGTDAHEPECMQCGYVGDASPVDAHVRAVCFAHYGTSSPDYETWSAVKRGFVAALTAVDNGLDASELIAGMVRP